MPLWQSEHFLQYLSALAIEFSDLEKVLPIFEVAINSRTARFKTKKGTMLTPQDVKFTIAEMRKESDTEEESNEESNDEEEEEEDEVGEEEVEEGVVELLRRIPTPEGPPRKRARAEITSTLPTTSHSTLPPHPSYSAEEIRTQLKERWDASDRDLDTVEVAFNMLTSEEGIMLSSSQIVNRFRVLKEYI